MPSSSRMEKIFANLFIIIATVFLMFILSELLMKFFLFHPTYNFQTPGMLGGRGNQLKVELVPDNLYEIRPNKELGINKYGFRDHNFSTQKHGMKRVCFLGDSFTMGLNVRFEETMPKMLEKKLKDAEVYNMGVVGFGPDQELKVLEKYGFAFKPDWVIEGICALNDSGDIFKNQLYTTGPKAELIETRTNPVKSMVFPSFFSIANAVNFIKNRNDTISFLDSILFGDSYDLTWMKYRDSDESKFKFSLMDLIFKRMKDELNARKINFLAVIIPSYDNICNDKFLKENDVDPEAYFVNEEFYQHILERENIPNINLAPFFMQLGKERRCGLYDEGNGHLSALGNWYAAQIIADYLTSHGQSKK